MRENQDFVVTVNILTPFAHIPFSTVCLDIVGKNVLGINSSKMQFSISVIIYIYATLSVFRSKAQKSIFCIIFLILKCTVRHRR